MKTTTFAVALTAVLFGAPALAQHAAYGTQGQYHAAQPPPGNPDDNCDHDRAHPGHAHQAFLARRGGGYELRVEQRWVEGYFQKTWVAGTCFGRHVVQVCSPGHYRQDWVAGHYVNEQRWVYVESRGHSRGWGRHWGRR